MKPGMVLAWLGALLLGAPVAAQTADDGLPEWMAGTWTMQDGSMWGDEVWMAPRGGVMIGMARVGFGSELENWEVTRIQRKADGRISFFAQPYGRPASEFPMAVTSEQAIEFANPQHDYPQRIRYWRQGQLLMAEISKMDGTKAVRFNYRPVAAPVLETPPPADAAAAKAP
ncbi:MAG: DUF6265 family protein [Novosphingobium sp.]